MSAFGLIGAGLVLCYSALGESASPSKTTNAAPAMVQSVSSATSLLDALSQYMPGATKESAGVRISPTNFTIVNQDGSGGQPNPPLNLGSYIQANGAFALEAAISSFKDSPASFFLYSQVPVIADEFRIEKPRLHFVVSDGKVIVEVFDGSKQTPITTQTYTFASNEVAALRLTSKNDQLTILVNQKQIGQLATYGILKDKIWFGADAPSGDWLLTKLAVAKEGNDAVQLVDVSKRVAVTHEAQGLQALASKKRPGFIVGSAMSPFTVASDQEYAGVALDSSQLGGWTPENAMKMQFLQPVEGKYSFQHADLLVKMAQQNGVSVHGHALVFGEGNPRWFNDLPVASATDKARIAKIMEQHIDTVVRHYGDKVPSWDVVNEPMADYDATPDGEGAVLRTHKWQQAMGEAFIAKSIVAAHKANPNAMLFINEYGLESDGDRWDAFVQLMTRLKTQLQKDGVNTSKIGVGFQAHVYEAEDRIDAAVLASHIRQLAALGFKSQISEMDVYTADGDAVQGAQYAAIFKTCMNEPACVAWRGWILSDRYNYWKDDDGQILQGKDGLFGTDMKPRPGYEYIQRLLN